MIKRRLIWKLFGINILVIAFLMVLVWVSIDYLAADYFATLMEKYHINPESSHAMFVAAAHRYLIWAGLGGCLLAALLCFLLLRRVLSPLIQMTALTSKISSGDYDTAVPVVGRDEVGQLAEAFNRMAANLKSLENLRKQLMIDVAHELRTPLTNIRGYLEALGDGVVAPDRATLAILQEETMRLVALTEDVLKLAKADTALKTLTPESLDLGRLIADALDVFTRLFFEKNIQVETDFSNPALLVEADAHMLAQVVRNLLSNASQYTPRDGYLQIKCEKADKSICVSFINNATDLTKADLPLLFERFYRPEKSRSRAHGGAGIGLAIVKELIAAHGGTVEATLESDMLCITITLPANNPI